MAVFPSRRCLSLVSGMGILIVEVVINMVATDFSNNLDPIISFKGRCIIYGLLFAVGSIYRMMVLLQSEASPERVAATASSHSAVDMPSQETQQYRLDNSVQSVSGIDIISLAALPESGDHFETEVRSQSAGVSESPGRAGDLDHTGVGSQPPNDPDVRAHIERPLGILPILSAYITMRQLQAMTTMAQLQAELQSAPVPQEPSTVYQWAPPRGELRIRKMSPGNPLGS